MKLTPYTEYAGFWRRFLAMILDSIWLLAIISLLLYLTQGSDYLLLESALLEESTALLEPLNWQSVAINEVLPILLIILFWLKYGGTPGKLLLDCKIVDARTGDRITTGQSILRSLGYMVSAFPLGLGFLWVIWDKRKQGWHDKIARTVVVIHDDSTIPLPELEKG